MKTCPKCGTTLSDEALVCGVCRNKFTPGVPIDPKEEETSGDEVTADLRHTGQAPMPTHPGAEMRQTLSGDYFETQDSSSSLDAPSDNQSARPGAPVTPPAGMGMRPSTPSEHRGTPHGAPMMVEHEKKSSSAVGWIIALVVLLALAAGGGWWYWQKTHSPGAAAEKIFSSIQAKDWKGLTDMIYMTDQQKQALETMSGGKMKAEDAIQKILSVVFSKIDLNSYSIDKQDVNGDNATVTATIVLTPSIGPNSGKQMKSQSDMKMIKVNGQWMVNSFPINPSNMTPVSP